MVNGNHAYRIHIHRYHLLLSNHLYGQPANKIGERQIRALNDKRNVVQFDPCPGTQSKLCTKCEV